MACALVLSSRHFEQDSNYLIIRCKRSDLESIIEETFGGGSYNVEIIDYSLNPKGYDIFDIPGDPFPGKMPLCGGAVKFMRVSYHARRWHVHVASAFPLAHH